MAKLFLVKARLGAGVSLRADAGSIGLHGGESACGAIGEAFAGCEGVGDMATSSGVLAGCN